ncbi:MAG: class I SAM-dependent methyltransferase [Patescibacteria group bacterium]|nr:class I SAM-dependent methyltransferase [Patescibacteria group bacterium]
MVPKTQNKQQDFLFLALLNPMIYFTERDDCPICGSKNAKIIYNAPMYSGEIFSFVNTYYEEKIPHEVFSGNDFVIKQCQCGFVWQKNILNHEAMNQFYSKWISPEKSLIKRTEAPTTYYQYIAKNIALLTNLINTKGSLSSFDFGMGWGHWAIMALGFGFESYGLEITEDRNQYAKVRGVKIIKSLLDSDTTFDLINAEQVFEHIPNPREVLENLILRLKTHGILQIAVPNGEKEVWKMQRKQWQVCKGAMQPLEHINTFTPKTLSNFVESCGLKLIKKQTYFNPVNGNLKILNLDPLPRSVFFKLQGCRMIFQKINLEI